MAVTLQQFHAQVSSAIGRGTSFDDKIPDCVRRAARRLETEFSFAYMQQHASVPAGDMATEFLQELFGDRIKKFIYVKATAVSAQGHENSVVIPKTQLINLVQRLDLISGFFTSFETINRFDFGWYAYTDWPESLSASPDLLQSYESLLKASSVMEAASDLRDDALIAFWSNGNNPLSYSALRTAALLAEQEAELAGENLVMQPWVL
jgi:hypothetical protein